MKMSKSFIPIILALFLLLACLPVHASERIAVVFRGDIALHQQLADKLIAKIAENGRDTLFKWEISADSSAERRERFLNQQPDIVVAFGDLALSFCLEAAPDVPGLFMLVSNQKLAGQALATDRWQGAKLWAPWEMQFAGIRKVLPKARSLGMVVNPSCQANKTEIEKAARQNGFKLHFVRVKSRRQIIPSLSSTFSQSDVFVMMPDPAMINTLILGEMIRLQKQYHKPLVAVSERLVELGAFMSIEYSLAEMIDKVAVKINESVTLENLAGQPKLAKCCMKTTINKKVAAQLGIIVHADVKNKVHVTEGRGGRR